MGGSNLVGLGGAGYAPDFDAVCPAVSAVDTSVTARNRRLIFLADYGDTTRDGFTEVGTRALMADAILLGGDNNYPDGEEATIEANTAILANMIAAVRVYPCLGNHDLDAFPPVAMTMRFPDIDNGCRYYTVSLGDYVDLFVLNSGLDSDENLVEVDGNSDTSVQHTWFAAAFAASSKPFKIVMFHHPFVAAASEADRVVAAMDWPEFKAAGVLVLNGHTHASCHITHESGLHLANASMCGQVTHGADSLIGVTTGCTLNYFDDSTLAVLQIDVFAEVLKCRFLRSDTGAAMYAFEVSAASRLMGATGRRGAAGFDGTAGADGIDAFTTTSATVVIPAVDGGGTIPVANSVPFQLSQPIFIEGGGYFTVTAKPNATTLTISNEGTPGNSLPNTALLSGRRVIGAGVPGLAGVAPTELFTALLVLKKNNNVGGGATDPQLGVGKNGWYNSAPGVLTESYDPGDIVVPFTDEIQDAAQPAAIIGVPACFSLAPGNYHIRVRMPGFSVNRFVCRMKTGVIETRNIGGTPTDFLAGDYIAEDGVIQGVTGAKHAQTRCMAAFGHSIQGHSVGDFYVAGGGPDRLFWLVFLSQSNGGANSLGVPSNFSEDEIYTTVKIWQLSKL